MVSDGIDAHVVQRLSALVPEARFAAPAAMRQRPESETSTVDAEYHVPTSVAFTTCKHIDEHLVYYLCMKKLFTILHHGSTITKHDTGLDQDLSLRTSPSKHKLMKWSTRPSGKACNSLRRSSP
jgi:hypothetical protein